MDRRAIAGTAVSPTCPRVHARHSRWMTVAEWKALGLTAVGKGWPADHLRAPLIEADGPGGRAFLTFDNYRALPAYNCSHYYAISVGLLAEAISTLHPPWRLDRTIGPLGRHRHFQYAT